jgi:hypothetical protein
MLVIIRRETWKAEVIISDTPDENGFSHLEIRTVAVSKEEAKEAAREVAKTYADGKLAVVRVAPEALSDKDFCTQEIKYAGYARLSFKDEPGEWHYMSREILPVPNIGEAHARS